MSRTQEESDALFAALVENERAVRKQLFEHRRKMNKEFMDWALYGEGLNIFDWDLS